MRRKGFTIAELLITLGIIAVIAATVAPAAHNILPDKYKTRVLRYYSLISSVTDNMLNNSDLYSTKFKTENGEYTPECLGLACTDKPEIAPYNTNTYKGDDKYKNLLISMLDLKKLSSNEIVSTDGTIWRIRKNADGSGYKITLIFGYPNSSAASASEKVYTPNTKNPDTFIFIVENEGKVKGGDALTYTYLKNPNNTSKKEDLEKAATNYTKYFKSN